jgi:ATP-binding cassette, subfamily B, bacterial MsbA
LPSHKVVIHFGKSAIIMKTIREIYLYTFVYKAQAVLTILFNFLFVIFNLVSLALFVPFLELIFKKEIPLIAPVKPSSDLSMFEYVSEYYTFFMESYLFYNGKEKALFFICISVLIAFFFKNLFRYLAIYHQSHLRMAVVRDVRNKIFKKTLMLPMSFYSEEKKGDLMSRMSSDVNEIEIAVISVLQLLFRDPIDVLLTVSLLLYWSPEMTLISFIVLPLSAFVISQIGKSLKRTAKEGQNQMGRVFSIIEETLGGIRIIKAFNASTQIQAKFERINARHQQLITRTFRKKDLSSPLNEFLGAFVMLVIVYFGGKLVLEESNTGMNGAQFMGFIIVFSQLLRPIQNIALSVGNLQKAKVSLDRINEILTTDEVIYDPKDPKEFKGIASIIRYENVSFSYGDQSVIRSISFDIPKGKTIALVGESGSGKSTLSDLLPRFYDVTSGKITFDGIDIRDFRVEDLRKEIGIVSQESILFNDSIRNNIAFGKPEATIEEVIAAAKIANAHEFIEQQENGYETNIGDRGNKLSGGQKQRISIARAILKDPEILILDEATSALDTESEKLVQDALEKLMSNRTSIVIAHRLSTIRYADEIIVLSQGEIVERGKHEDLIQAKGHYYRLCTLQGIGG